MSVRTVVVCQAQVPFVTGGAESHVRALVQQLSERGFETELVRIPFKEYPKDEILAHAAAWRLIDLSESNGRPIDLGDSHQVPDVLRASSPKSRVAHSSVSISLRALRNRVQRLRPHPVRTWACASVSSSSIVRCWANAGQLFTNAQNTANRVKRFNGLDAAPLYHPPPLAGRLRSGSYGDYVLAVGRLEPIKRVDLALEAMTDVDPETKLIVVGDGSQRTALEKRTEELSLRDRVVFLGQIDDEQLIELYAGALAILYAPYDEDYGYITLEAFLAHRPVVTATDSGGTLEFVDNDVNGVVCEPSGGAIAVAINRLAGDRRRAAALGDAGFERAREITWDGVIDALTSA